MKKYTFTLIALISFFISPYLTKAQSTTKVASVKVTGEVTSGSPKV
jgi:FlaG/FlaF family flagellin (archaellin)